MRTFRVTGYAISVLVGCAGVALAGCGGGTAAPTTARVSPALPASITSQRAAYAAGVRAQRTGDYETAMDSFRAAGSYRDARARLAAVLKVAGAAELAAARQKLRTGHPRAAVVLVQVAMRDYGDTGPEARSLLARAEAAQAAHHRQQMAEQQRLAARQGKR